MENQSGFFRGASRLITLGSPTLQVSNRRICIPIKMPLNGEDSTDMPDWLCSAYAAVSKSFTEVSPNILQLTDLTLAFKAEKQDGKLFESPNAKVSSAEIRKFKVMRVGSRDDPQVELHFKVYIAFNRKFWAWIGEMAGEEVHMAFPSNLGEVRTEEPESEPLPFIMPEKAQEAALAAAGEEEALDFPASHADAPRPSTGPASRRRKSGPKELRAKHEKAAKEETKLAMHHGKGGRPPNPGGLGPARNFALN
jgi:hypothetical protein